MPRKRKTPVRKNRNIKELAEKPALFHYSMTDHQLQPSEDLWESILSREQRIIKKAFHALSAQEKKTVLLHLKRMSTEDGWHTSQVESAIVALEFINMDS